MLGNATREELSEFPLDEQGHVSAIVLLAREECLQMPRQNPVQHRLLGPAWAIALASADSGARYIRSRQTLYGKAALAGLLPLPAPFWSGTYDGRPLKDRGKHDNLFRVFHNKSIARSSNRLIVPMGGPPFIDFRLPVEWTLEEDRRESPEPKNHCAMKTAIQAVPSSVFFAGLPRAKKEFCSQLNRSKP